MAKVRFGFVSNSSSSSFICEICGRTETVYDGDSREFGFVECENGHLFCEEEIIDSEGIPDEELYGNEDDDDIDEGMLREKYCPICNFIEPSYPELASYLRKTSNITNKEVFEEIKKVNKRRKVLREPEYVEYVLRKQDITVDVLLKNLKEEYKTYKTFKERLWK